MKNLFLTFVLFSLLSSCKKELEPQSTTIATPPVPENSNVPVTPVAAPQTVPTAQNSGVQSAPQQVAAQQVVAAPQKVAKGMNPPHGQPNHRCDIAVGAPLNSPVSKTKSFNVPAATNGNATVIPVKTAEVAAPEQLQTPEAVATPVEKKAE